MVEDLLAGLAKPLAEDVPALLKEFHRLRSRMSGALRLLDMAEEYGIEVLVPKSYRTDMERVVYGHKRHKKRTASPNNPA